MNLSILDLVFINEGHSVKDAFDQSLLVAQKAESFGYKRIWLAEHHNSSSIASAATSLCISHIAHGTKTIRVGAGGIMLPNHSPLVIAEQFGTLETLYPGRIDLGLGRAPGTDQQTVRALRADPSAAQNFPDDVLELQRYFSKEAHKDPIVATPGAGLEVPLWVLGSSTFGAQLSAKYGLPYAFASHFAPDALFEALKTYHQNFVPSKQQNKPYVTLGVNVIIADTQQEADYLSTSLKQAFTHLVRGTKGKLFSKPISDIESYWSPQEKMAASHMMTYSFIGTKESVAQKLKHFVELTQADELMVVTPIYDIDKRIESLRQLGEIGF